MKRIFLLFAFALVVASYSNVDAHNTGSTPTIEVAVDIDGSWLQGIWVEEYGDVYMFFDNGTYKSIIRGQDVEIGTYKLAADSVVLTPYKYDGRIWDDLGCTHYVVLCGEELARYRDTKSYGINIGDMSRCDNFHYEDEGCNLYITREDFFKAKESVKVLLKK